MQLLVEFAAPDHAAFRSGLEARAEARALAGVNLLQVWHDASDPAQALCLFELRDRKRAEDWLRVETALHGAARPRFLETA